MGKFWQRMIDSLRYRGPVFTAFWCALFALRLHNTNWFIAYRERQFDRRYGVDTAGHFELDELDLQQPQTELGEGYEPSTPEVVAAMLRDLQIDYRNYVFVDLGCGKGLPLLMASMFPFRRIVGVEWSAQFCDVARRNVRTFRGPYQRCHQFEVICDDAAAYRFPDDPLVIFTFNSLREEITSQILSNLRDSLHENRRHMVIVYYNPICAGLIAEADFLRLVRSTNHSHSVAVYEALTPQTVSC